MNRFVHLVHGIKELNLLFCPISPLNLEPLRLSVDKDEDDWVTSNFIQSFMNGDLG